MSKSLPPAIEQDLDRRYGKAAAAQGYRAIMRQAEFGRLVDEWGLNPIKLATAFLVSDYLSALDAKGWESLLVAVAARDVQRTVDSIDGAP